MSRRIAISIENVSKTYRLGSIGGQTLQEERVLVAQSWMLVENRVDSCAYGTLRWRVYSGVVCWESLRRGRFGSGGKRYGKVGGFGHTDVNYGEYDEWGCSDAGDGVEFDRRHARASSRAP